MSAVLAPLTIEKLVPGGKGLARLQDGRVALLQAVAPGDQVEVLQAKEHKGYVEVEHWRLLQPSAQRSEPTCPVATRCGGCDWMMLSPAAQAQAKLSIVREALARTGKIHDLPEPFVLVQSPQTLGYRSRIRLQLSQSGRVGFHSAASHELVEAEACAVASEPVNRALARLRDVGRRHPRALGTFAHVEIRAAPDGSVSLCFTRDAKERASRAENRQLFADLEGDFRVCSDDDAQDEGLWQRYPLPPNIELLAPPSTFTQVNWAVNQLLVAEVLRSAAERSIKHFLELYCGSGNFTLPLLASGLSGVAVEANAQAIAAARRAASEQHLPVSTFQAQEAGAYMKGARLRGERHEWLLVDPPRAGIKTGLDEIASVAERFIAICSCDPVTLARDLRGLLNRGFALERITAFDMFPQTHHVETLTWLVRK